MNTIDTASLGSSGLSGRGLCRASGQAAMGLVVGLLLGIVCQHPILWSVVGMMLGLFGSRLAPSSC